MRDKPRIPEGMLAKWQRVVDILARLLDVPAGLIMKRVPPEHRVFIASLNQDNPYVVDDTFTLDTGLYCDTVMRDRRLLLVRDATKDPAWDRNPDLKHGMVFYLGLPLAWPDGSIFGTICVLDEKTNEHAIAYTDLLAEFKEVVESDLAFLVEAAERKAAQRALEKARDELECRVGERTKELEEANTALRVLLKQIEDSRTELEERILSNVNRLIFPHLDRLRRRVADEKGRAYIDIVEANLNELTSPFGSHLSVTLSRLTPTELQIAKLVIQGKTTKMIAGILNTATSTVNFHRNNIRRKVGIRSARVNLRAWLASLH